MNTSLWVCCILGVQVAEVAVLMGLMCKYSCEEGQLIVFGNSGSRDIELEKGTILQNVESVLKLSAVSITIFSLIAIINYFYQAYYACEQLYLLNCFIRRFTSKAAESEPMH